MRLELARAIRSLYSEFVAFLVVDEARLDELRHQVGGDLPGRVLLLELEDLLLELLDLGLLGQRLRLFLLSSLLFGLDLRLRASSFAGHLEHIRRDALGD